MRQKNKHEAGRICIADTLRFYPVRAIHHGDGLPLSNTGCIIQPAQIYTMVATQSLLRARRSGRRRRSGGRVESRGTRRSSCRNTSHRFACRGRYSPARGLSSARERATASAPVLPSNPPHSTPLPSTCTIESHSAASSSF